MEIYLTTFQKRCPLLQTHGYKINGGTKTGVMMVNKYKTTSNAKDHIQSICFSCDCHTKGNCRPEVETLAVNAEIYAKVE